MKSGFGLACLALWLFAVPAQADTIRVSSGDHPDFTRLVLKLPAETNWSINRRGRRAFLSLSGPDTVFDTNAVFARIGRERLQAVEQPEPGAPLTLSLSCACEVTSQVEPGNWLVIDIKDKSGLDPIWEGLPPLPNAVAYRFSQVAPSASAVPETPERPAPSQINAADLLPMPPAVTDVEPRRTASTEIFQDRLLKQLTRAASQGLVEMDAPVLRRPDPSINENVDRSQSLESDTARGIGITASTALDQAMGMRRPGDGAITPPECLAPALVNLQQWGTEDPFALQLANARRNMVADLDRIDEDAVLDLAKTYLFFGFGVEATRQLSLISLAAADLAVLEGIAAVLDDIPRTTSEPFIGHEACASAAPLWLLLSTRGSRPPPSLNMEAIHQNFVAFPRHIRELLGPRLSDRLAQIGEVDTAENILMSLSRIDPDGSDQRTLALARLDEAKGETESASAGFEEVAQTGGDQSAEALVDLVQARFASREAMDAADLILLDAYAQENRGTPLAAQIANARSLALALQGDFDAAIAASQASDARQHSDDVIQLLVEQADDVTFLAHALALLGSQASQLPEPTAEAMAKRLLDLGFAEQAQLILDRIDGPVTQERRLLQARVALMTEKPNQALLSLVGLLSEESDALRADGYLMSARPLQAGALYQKNGATDAAQRAFWLAGYEAEDAPMAEGRYANLMAIEATLTSPLPVQDQAGLQGSQALLSLSEERRDALGRLLGTVREPTQQSQLGRSDSE